MPSKKKIFRIGNLADPFANVKLSQLPREADGIKNMSFDEWGNLVKRPGYAKYNTNIVASVSTTVDANSASGQKVLNVTATTTFAVAEAIIINSGGDREETGVIASIQSGVSLTLEVNLAYTHTQAQADAVNNMHKISGLQRFYKQTESSKYTLCVCDTILYSLTNSAGHAGTSEKTGLTAEADTHFTDFIDTCLIANGNEDLLKFDGTDVWLASVGVPSAPSGVAGSSGSLSAGDYKYKVTYVDADGNESNASTASSAVTATADQKITVTIPVYSGSDYDIAKRRIYRTLADGASYYKDGEVADNSTTTFNSTQADTTLVTQNSLENKHGQDHYAPPTDPTIPIIRGGRVYLAIGKSLYYGKRYYEYFPAGYYINTGNMRNITGVINQLHTLQVATKGSIERLLGTSARVESADYFQFKDSYSSKGVYATRSMVDCDNLIVFLHKDGLYTLNVDRTNPLNTIVNEYLKANLNQSAIGTSCACFYDGKYMLSYPKGANTVPSETVWVDMLTGAYGVYDFAFNIYSVWDKDGEDSLKAGSTTIGRVYDVLTGLEDDGSAIEAYDTTGFLNFGKPDTWKQIHDIYVKIKSTTGTALRCYYTLDENTETYKDLTLTANKTKWYRIRLSGTGQRCRELKIRPRISDKYAFEIQGYQIVYDEESVEWG